MKDIVSGGVILVLLASLIGCTSRSGNRIIYQRHAGYNYCHTKAEVPSRDPLRPGEREIVDYYGRCDAFD